MKNSLQIEIYAPNIIIVIITSKLKEEEEK